MNKYYVYVYMNPFVPFNQTFENFYFEFEPFYIGKGSKNRKLDHLNHVIKNKDKNFKNTSRYFFINEILKNGLKPIIEIIKYFDNDIEAYEFESQLIKKIGRKINNSGSLTNIQIDSKHEKYSGLPGEYNPMFGISPIQRMINKNGLEEGIKKYENWKKLISKSCIENNGIRGKKLIDSFIKKYGEVEGKIKYEILQDKCRNVWNNMNEEQRAESNKKNSENNSGEKNGMFGNHFSKIWEEKYGKEIAQQKKKEVIKKIKQTFKEKKEIKIKEYLKNPKLCLNCSKIISYENRYAKTCCRSCGAKARGKK